MYRLIEKKFQAWKNGGMRKPLMVIGARKIGKTYTIQKFCKENFANYLYFNLATDIDIKNIFEKKLDDKMIIERLELYIGKRIDVENTIIFFDEIQVSKNFISSLQYFAKAKLPYKIICTGNLLGVKLHRYSKTISVEKVKIEYMHPMNFEEFLLAARKKSLVKQIKECYEELKTMPDFEHEEAFNLFRKYLCVGGLPEAVLNFLENDLNILDYDPSIVSDIVTMYIADMKSYVKSVVETRKLENLYQNIPAQLVSGMKNFRYNLIDADGRKRKFEAPINWLLNANLILIGNKVQTKKPSEFHDGNFRLYLNDVGILSRMSNTKYSDIMLNKEFEFKDAIVKNYVAEELTSNGADLRYWFYGKNAKIDFIIHNDDGIIPIVVKSGESVKSAGLNTYMRNFMPEYIIRLASTNFYTLHGVRSIPLYAAFCIKGE